VREDLLLVSSAISSLIRAIGVPRRDKGIKVIVFKYLLLEHQTGKLSS
jgi:hypothetical protein